MTEGRAYEVEVFVGSHPVTVEIESSTAAADVCRGATRLVTQTPLELVLLAWVGAADGAQVLLAPSEKVLDFVNRHGLEAAPSKWRFACVPGIGYGDVDPSTHNPALIDVFYHHAITETQWHNQIVGPATALRLAAIQVRLHKPNTRAIRSLLRMHVASSPDVEDPDERALRRANREARRRVKESEVSTTLLVARALESYSGLDMLTPTMIFEVHAMAASMRAIPDVALQVSFLQLLTESPLFGNMLFVGQRPELMAGGGLARHGSMGSGGGGGDGGGDGSGNGDDAASGAAVVVSLNPSGLTIHHAPSEVRPCFFFSFFCCCCWLPFLCICAHSLSLVAVAHGIDAGAAVGDSVVVVAT